jgi:hypothetical protein
LEEKNPGKPEVVETYRNLFLQVTDPCWQTEEPSRALDSLKKQLSLAGGEVPECPTKK